MQTESNIKSKIVKPKRFSRSVTKINTTKNGTSKFETLNKSSNRYMVKVISGTNIKHNVFKRPKIVKVENSKVVLPQIRCDQSGLKIDIDKKYGTVFERNIPMLVQMSGFTRAQLIHYYTLFKALVQLNAGMYLPILSLIFNIKLVSGL